MSHRALIERMARALCGRDAGDPDAPVHIGILPVTSFGGQVTSLFPLLSDRSDIIPLWACYIVDARRAATAAGLIAEDEYIDFSDVPRWELVKKEAKDPK